MVWPPDPGWIANLARRLLRIRDDAIAVEASDDDNPHIDGVLLQAKRPFTNVRHVRALLATLTGDIVWLDRHADIVALDVIGFATASSQHRSIIVVREGRPEERLIREATRLRQEMAVRGVDFDFRCVPANQWDAHDRWIVAAEGVWSLPPANALSKVGEMKPSSDPDGVRSVVSAHLENAASVFG